MQRHNNEIIYGCMGLGGGWNDNAVSKTDIQQANTLVDAALDLGITVFDHADIYAKSKAEQVFGEVLAARPHLRDKMHIQTKCGIRFEDEQGPKRYDFSAQWIEHSVEHSLKRLKIEQIDTLLLHRPDALVDIEALATTFTALHKSGKVNAFGVSNMNRHQIALLQSAIAQPIAVNQLELSLLQPRLVTEGLLFNTGDNNNGHGTLEYCYENNIKIQVWASLGKGKLTGGKTETENERATADLIAKLAAEYAVSKEAIAIAWLLALPMAIQPVLGTTNPERLAACMQATDVNLSHAHWYALLVTILGNELP